MYADPVCVCVRARARASVCVGVRACVCVCVQRRWGQGSPIWCLRVSVRASGSPPPHPPQCMRLFFHCSARMTELYECT